VPVIASLLRLLASDYFPLGKIYLAAGRLVHIALSSREDPQLARRIYFPCSLRTHTAMMRSLDARIAFLKAKQSVE
jgi:hypothetical protein